MTQLNKSCSYEPTFIKIYDTENNKSADPVREIFFYLEKARENRVTSDNKYNERSSRSHSIFQLFINSENTESGKETKLNG